MSSAPATQRVRVLVIDDDAVMREVLDALLTAEEYAVDTAESGEAALAYLDKRRDSSQQADAILTDVQLPGVSGPALAAELRRAAPRARLIAMSGSEPAPGLRAAFDGFLLKPFATEEFVRLLVSPEAAHSPTQVAEESQAKVLDEATYNGLAAALPAPQLAELYQLTLADVSARLGLLSAALAEGDLAAYRREAHALKGGCSMVGARELAALAAEAENAETGASAGTTFASIPPAIERLRHILSSHFMHNE